jgi:hypothetical protein
MRDAMTGGLLAYCVCHDAPITGYDYICCQSGLVRRSDLCADPGGPGFTCYEPDTGLPPDAPDSAADD